jgi:hypothetical protein
MTKRRIILLFGAGIVLVAASVIFPSLAVNKKRAQSMSCVSHMVSICFAGRFYASDNGGHFPTNFTSMSNELVTPRVLHCPGDSRNVWITNWDNITSANCSYAMVTPGVHEDATNTVFIRCSVHGHLGYPDDTVFDGVRRRGK